MPFYVLISSIFFQTCVFLKNRERRSFFSTLATELPFKVSGFHWIEIRGVLQISVRTSGKVGSSIPTQGNCHSLSDVRSCSECRTGLRIYSPCVRRKKRSPVPGSRQQKNTEKPDNEGRLARLCTANSYQDRQESWPKKSPNVESEWIKFRESKNPEEMSIKA